MTTTLQNPLPWRVAVIHDAATVVPPDPLFMEHRWGRRRPCRAGVCISTGGVMAGSARLRDVSMSGAFLETTLYLPLYSQLSVAMLHDLGSRQTGNFSATVVRREKDGVGIEWSETASMPVCRFLNCTEACASVNREPVALGC
jgi:hypothetical protein